MAVWDSVKFADVKKNWRYDAEYWQPIHVKNEILLERAAQQYNIKTNQRYDIKRLDDLVERITGSAFYPSIAEQYSTTSGMPFIRVADIGEFFVKQGGGVRIPKELVQSLPQIATVKEEDVIIAKGGSIGGVCIVQPGMGTCAVSRDVIAIKTDAQKIDSYYLVAFLKSRVGQLQLDRYKSQQVQPHLTFPSVGNIKVLVPPREVQSSVSKLVKEALDKKRQSQILYSEAETLLLQALGLDLQAVAKNYTYIVGFKQTTDIHRIDAEYFRPKYQTALNLFSRSGKQIKDFVKLRKQRFKPQIGKPFKYIEIGGLTDDGRAESEIVMGENAPSRAQWIVQPGDIITSTVRPIRRLTAMIEDNDCICSSGFAVLTPEKIEPELLMVYLRLPIVSEILDLHTTASMYPAISVPDILKIPLTLPKSEVQAQVISKIQTSRRSLKEATSFLNEARLFVESVVSVEEE